VFLCERKKGKRERKYRERREVDGGWGMGDRGSIKNKEIKE
jgi:hypothetical protein